MLVTLIFSNLENCFVVFYFSFYFSLHGHQGGTK